MTDVTREALRLLEQERDRISKAIELLQGGGGSTAAVSSPEPAPAAEAPRRRGRPPGTGKVAKKAGRKKRAGRREMTPEEKQAVSDRMKKYWAARRKGKK